MDNVAAWKRLEGWGEEPSSVAILTDINGTLAPIVPTPDLSEVAEELRGLLRELSGKYLLVAGISGRKTEDALDLIGLDEVVYFGNHGFEILRDGEVEVVPDALPYFEIGRAHSELQSRQYLVCRLLLEKKKISLLKFL